jgi:hypothetical protein
VQVSPSAKSSTNWPDADGGGGIDHRLVDFMINFVVN